MGHGTSRLVPLGLALLLGAVLGAVLGPGGAGPRSEAAVRNPAAAVPAARPSPARVACDRFPCAHEGPAPEPRPSASPAEEFSRPSPVTRRAESLAGLQDAAREAALRGDEAALEGLLLDLGTEVAADRVSAARVVEALARETDPRVLDLLAGALCGVEDAEAAARLAELVESLDSGPTLEAALRALATMGSAEAVPAVARAILRAREPSLAVLAMDALPVPQGVAPPTAGLALTALQAAARSPEPEVRARALFGIGEWAHEPIHSQVLLDALRDPHPEVRRAAAAALEEVGRRPDEAALSLLSAVMEDPREELGVRLAAWGTLRDAGVVPSEVALGLDRFRLENAEAVASVLHPLPDESAE
ncbi:MAG: HEAT repeat domain-containing protein [Planctomycetes bacterium]|nr:HEAT repeat domain-containing protein [Planctomycetota bacterium]